MTDDELDRDKLSSFACPLPRHAYPSIVLGHGGGGKLSGELVDQLLRPAFDNPVLDQLGDAARLPPLAGTWAFSTDSFVVRPLFFPGGSIAELAIHGTVNDLAMAGARPRYLSAGLILEEGFPLEQLNDIVLRMAAAARQAGVQVVTGDTKVVERGHGDGLYINTSGVGEMLPGVLVGPERARAGNVILCSGTIADHGMAIMSVREGLEFETPIASDTAALASLVDVLAQTAPAALRVMRDPTRGGVASALNEIARQSRVGIQLQDDWLPVEPATQAACELLGLDPLYVANEGKMLAIVEAAAADKLLAVMRAHPLGQNATKIGVVTDQHPGTVVSQTTIGGQRVVTMQIGEQLPRIC